MLAHQLTENSPDGGSEGSENSESGETDTSGEKGGEESSEEETKTDDEEGAKGDTEEKKDDSGAYNYSRHFSRYLNTIPCQFSLAIQTLIGCILSIKSI